MQPRPIAATLTACLLGILTGAPRAAINISPPPAPVRLVFIHHSTGENWLADDHGGLGLALRDNNWHVSDTNYGWGPDGIGDLTDIGHWWLWFRGPDSPAYLAALYSEDGQHASYARLGTTPAGDNQVILFKGCFPNSALQGEPLAVPPPITGNPLRGEDSGSEYHTLANAKGIYSDLLEYFRSRPDKLFVAVTAPPLSDPAHASNARAFNQWLVHDWLQGYPGNNVAVLDLFNVLTSNGGDAAVNDLGSAGGNHHRWRDGRIEHLSGGDPDAEPDVLEYPSDDDHPGPAGTRKATAELVPVLNAHYHCWQGSGDCPRRLRPDSAANGGDGPLVTGPDQPLRLSLRLEAGIAAGGGADWWVLAATPVGWFQFVSPGQWAVLDPGGPFLPWRTEPLADLADTEILNLSGLPAGDYQVYFGVDTRPNGTLELPLTRYDGVTIRISP
jgi:hypothetical protein